MLHSDDIKLENIEKMLNREGPVWQLFVSSGLQVGSNNNKNIEEESLDVPS